jgi:surface polysaccharide O-acyltransferase-like enzyme
MIRSALFLSLTVMILIAFVLFDRLTFLASQKKLLFSHSGLSFGIYFTILALNLFAAAITVNRKLFLKDTGRKLSHFDKHLQAANLPGTANPLEEVQ